MNQREKSVAKRNTLQRNKRTDNLEEASRKRNMKVDIGNASPQHSYDSRVAGHSTPIRRKEYINDIEDSPELDYRCSPISLPCTQEGGNEVSWDWQISSTKCSNENSKPPNSLVETPKRTKQLQKKRNSNSPLLQKPLKRKQVKMENIENIGRLAAELKALTEKMKNMQENCNNRVAVNVDDTECELESKLLIELNEEIGDNVMIQVVDDDKCKVNSITVNNNTKKTSSYEDLFDDSIDDSMVRCSQEIEEKLNLTQSKRSETIEVNIVSQRKEKEPHCLTSTSVESFRSFNTSKSSSTDTSGQLKTYSNNSSKTNAVSSFSFSNLKNTSLQKGSCKNSVAHTSAAKLQEKDILDFPDDSFDDCLATCIEDDKLLTKLSEYDFNASDSGRNPNNSKKIPKETVSSSNLPPEAVDTICNDKFDIQNSMFIIDDLLDEFSTDKGTIPGSLPGKTTLENRKFFKTKSLSDQCFYQNSNLYPTTKTAKPSSCVVSIQKRFQSNSNDSSVSTNSIAKNQNFRKTNNFASINGAENAHALDRLNGKEDGNYIIKCNSTSNLNSIKEITKQSQAVKCTPEEIEQKRLEAKMKLEAKRKLQQSGRMANTASQVPIKKSVKR